MQRQADGVMFIRAVLTRLRLGRRSRRPEKAVACQVLMAIRMAAWLFVETRSQSIDMDSHARTPDAQRMDVEATAAAECPRSFIIYINDAYARERGVARTCLWNTLVHV